MYCGSYVYYIHKRVSNYSVMLKSFLCRFVSTTTDTNKCILAKDASVSIKMAW